MKTVNTTTEDGVICYSMDGYENYDYTKITADSLDSKAYIKTDLKTTDPVNTGDPVYKIVDSEDWSLIIPLSAKQIVQLNVKSSVRVKFLKDGSTQVGKLTILTSGDGSYYGKIDFSNGMLRYIDERFIDVELVTNSNIGLKIPVSSVTSKSFYTIPEEYELSGGDSNNAGFLRLIIDKDGNETTEFVEATLYEHKDGKYYVDTSEFSKDDIIVRDGVSGDRFIIGVSDSLEGVYCMNKGYAVFRKINILDKNEEYCIAEKGTGFGISQFDYIVLDASKVKDQQITANG